MNKTPSAQRSCDKIYDPPVLEAQIRHFDVHKCMTKPVDPKGLSLDDPHRRYLDAMSRTRTIVLEQIEEVKAASASSNREPDLDALRNSKRNIRMQHARDEYKLGLTWPQLDAIKRCLAAMPEFPTQIKTLMTSFLLSPLGALLPNMSLIQIMTLMASMPTPHGASSEHVSDSDQDTHGINANATWSVF